MRRTTRTLTALTLGSTLAVGGAAWAAQNQAQGQGQTEEQKQGGASGGQATGAGKERQLGTTSQSVMTTGIIQSIDKEKRTVVLKDPVGEQVKVQVPQDLTMFDQLKKGQKVDLDYTESLAVSVLPAGGGTPGTQVRAHVEPTQAGGLVGREVTVTAQIVSVDARNKVVGLKLPSGQIQRITVQDPDIQKQLPNLKPGELATFTYTEAVAAKIQPSSGGRAQTSGGQQPR
jgi:hypothetical protein